MEIELSTARHKETEDKIKYSVHQRHTVTDLRQLSHG